MAVEICTSNDLIVMPVFPHGASLKFPSEAGYILRYAGKAGEPSRQRRGFRSYLNGLVVFPTFFNLNMNFAMRSSEPQSAPGPVFAD